MCPTGTILHLTNNSDDATPEFRQAFAVMDSDHDGKISGDDLRSFYALASSKNGDRGEDEDDMIKAMINVADANKDGFVQYEEFEGMMVTNKAKKNDGGVMEELFRVMDKDGDGKLGVDDLRSYLNLIGINNVDDDEIMAMIKLGGGDEDVRDGVSFNGFVHILNIGY